MIFPYMTILKSSLKEDNQESTPKNVLLSFEFQHAKLIIEHALISNIGEFTIFCLKALKEGASINDISNITLLHADNINEQLSFAKSIGYIGKDDKLTDRGNYLISIIDFIENYRNTVDLYLDTYIDEVGLKKLFSKTSIDKVMSKEGILFKNQIKTTRLIRIANEYPRSKIIEYLKTILPDYSNFIEEEKNRFFLSMEFQQRCIITLPFTVDELLKIVSFDSNLRGLTVGIPVLVYDPIFTTLFQNGTTNSLLKEWASLNRHVSEKSVYNLLNGRILNSDACIQNQGDDNVVYLDKMVDPQKVSIIQDNVSIPGYLFFCLEMKKTLQEKFALGKIEFKGLSKIFEDKIK